MKRLTPPQLAQLEHPRRTPPPWRPVLWPKNWEDDVHHKRPHITEPVHHTPPSCTITPRLASHTITHHQTTTSFTIHPFPAWSPGTPSPGGAPGVATTTTATVSIYPVTDTLHSPRLQHHQGAPALNTIAPSSSLVLVHTALHCRRLSVHACGQAASTNEPDAA
jgi:hypothetical protein